MTTKNPNRWTDSDFDAHVAKVRDAIAPSHSLRAYLEANAPLGRLKRVPIGLIQELKGGQQHVAIAIMPWIPIRPVALVVSEESARDCDLIALKVGISDQGANGRPIPLNTFSVKYHAEHPHMIDLQTWNVDTIGPGVQLFVEVRNRTSEPVEFRGILWANASYPY